MKPIKNIEDLIGDKRFKFPSSLANDRVNGNLCISVTIGGMYTAIPVEEYVSITYPTFCLLKDIGIIKHGDHFEEGKEFNPWE